MLKGWCERKHFVTSCTSGGLLPRSTNVGRQSRPEVQRERRCIDVLTPYQTLHGIQQLCFDQTALTPVLEQKVNVLPPFSLFFRLSSLKPSRGDAPPWRSSLAVWWVSRCLCFALHSLKDESLRHVTQLCHIPAKKKLKLLNFELTFVIVAHRSIFTVQNF